MANFTTYLNGGAKREVRAPNVHVHVVRVISYRHFSSYSLFFLVPQLLDQTLGARVLGPHVAVSGDNVAMGIINVDKSRK